jgi:polyferredoxin
MAFFIFFSALVFNLGAMALAFPVLWTWRLNPNVVGDSFTAIQLMLSGWSTGVVVFPWVAVASFVLVGVLIGKSSCGRVCPFGFVQDLVGFVKRKQTDVSLRTHSSLVYVKYGILGLTLLISAIFAVANLAGLSATYQSGLGIFTQAPFTVLSPSETLLGAIPQLMNNFRITLLQGSVQDALLGFTTLAPLFWVQFAIMVGVLGFAAYVPRGWCRYFCPHGAIMAIMNRFSFVGLRREPFKCEKVGCGKCVQVCPTRVPILDLPWEKFSHPECIYCMKCVDACEHKAIKLTYP